MLTVLRRLAPVLLLFLAACGGGEQAASVERKQSADDISYEPVIQQMYTGYFGRPADIEGLGFFAAQYRAANAPSDIRSLSAQYPTNAAVRALVDSFASSQESKDLYPGDDTAFLTRIYRQIFNREPDPAGLAFWSNAIAQGHVTRASAVLSIMAGATSTDMQLMDKKVAVARQFTRSLPDLGQEYTGMESSQLARAMLSTVTLETDLAQFQRTIDLVIANVVALRSGYAEVAAADRRIAFIVGADQAMVNTRRIDALAASLAADLNTRATAFGPRWSVQVMPAGPNASAVRDQLKGFAGAILIGTVPVPIHVDAYYNHDAPYLDPLRLPHCPSYTFDASGARLNASTRFQLEDPRCRNGITVSVLRGRSVSNGLADIAAKLEQMTSYHAASAAANAGWTARYDFVQALWAGGIPWTSPQWSDIALYAAADIHYTISGKAAARKAAFADCLARNQEMCGFNGHGSPQLIQFEGTGTAGTFYSPDVATMNAAELAFMPVNAKFVGLISCSTQNFLHDNSFATTLLAAGKTLLTLGMTQVSMVSDSFEEEQVTKRYTHLAVGASYADAFAGMFDGTPLNFQGDPYISLRPVPTGGVPKLLIDDRHYNEGSGILTITLPDSVDGAKSTRTLTIRNAGSADLNIKLTMMTYALGVDGAAPAYQMIGGLGFALESPVVSTTSGSTDLGNVQLTVKPGATLPLVYSMAPVLGNGVTKVNGAYSGRLEILSNDPASFHTFLEMRGAVR